MIFFRNHSTLSIFLELFFKFITEISSPDVEIERIKVESAERIARIQAESAESIARIQTETAERIAEIEAETAMIEANNNHKIKMEVIQYLKLEIERTSFPPDKLYIISELREIANQLTDK